MLPFFPIIPFLCWLAGLGGCGGLYWYGTLSNAQRAMADTKAAEIAMKLFAKAVAQLSKSEAKHVLEWTQRHFTNN